MFSSLSDIQRKAVFERRGKFVLRACPGSGKTFTVAARLANDILHWGTSYQGIAALSFTNVAWLEIERQLGNRFSIRPPVSFPHFLGTIDSFVDRYILLPFGHLVMGCDKRPTLVGEPHGPWAGRDFYERQFTNITFDAQGVPYLLRRQDVNSSFWRNHNDRFLTTKRRLCRSGFASQVDANYWAMRILEQYPQVARALAIRFPMFIVDEAQDSSETQMRILDLLAENGLNELMLVGDPDQAIFEWHHARPELLEHKFETWRANSLVLNENRRSSQRICDFTHPLSSLSERSAAVDPEICSLSYVPRIVTYDDRSLLRIIDQFMETCRDEGIKINPNNVAVLSRSRDITYKISGIEPVRSADLPWVEDGCLTRDLVRGKYLWEHHDPGKGFRIIERALVRKEQNICFCSQEAIENITAEIGPLRFNSHVHELINALPTSRGAIGDWVDSANRVLNALPFEVYLRYKRSKRSADIDALFLQDANIQLPYRLGTIHSAKGETFEAVLVILKSRGYGKYYRTLLSEGAGTKDDEELRIVYVGLTRPRRLLMLAVPSEQDREAWTCRLLA